LNRYTWTYAAGDGKNYHVGLFHGNRTGHVLIYCNANIVAIDFSVFESKKYSFFIDDELCGIHLDRRGDEMFYFFEIDKVSDTPRNRVRHQLERRYFKQMWLAMAAFAGVVGLIIGAIFLKDRPIASDALLPEKSSQTVGRVTIDKSAAPFKVAYHFVAGNQGYTAKPTAKQMTGLSDGLPLEPGDEFVVYYAYHDPRANRIDFTQPTNKQIGIYLQRTKEKYLQLHPAGAGPLLDCMIEVAYDMKGMSGLADFYFQDVPSAANPAHNEHSFQRLAREVPYLQKVKETCY